MNTFASQDVSVPAMMVAWFRPPGFDLWGREGVSKWDLDSGVRFFNSSTQSTYSLHFVDWVIDA